MRYLLDTNICIHIAKRKPVQALDAGVAEDYGRLRTRLEKKGPPIGALDLLIAAQALSLGLTLVTNNVREFARVEGLTVENWAA
jgi:tRNA(fMet)-specific endonuclease VapC